MECLLHPWMEYLLHLSSDCLFWLAGFASVEIGCFCSHVSLTLLSWFLQILPVQGLHSPKVKVSNFTAVNFIIFTMADGLVRSLLEDFMQAELRRLTQRTVQLHLLHWRCLLLRAWRLTTSLIGIEVEDSMQFSYYWLCLVESWPISMPGSFVKRCSPQLH